MLTNKCYITAQFKSHTQDFIHITLNEMPYIVYIGNFKNTDKIIAKLQRDIYFNAICRVRLVYEPEYPEFNSRIIPELHSFYKNLKQNVIWLEAIKITSLPEGKLTGLKESGYFTLQDTYKNIYQFKEINDKLTEVTADNQDRLVTIHGNFNIAHTLSIYKILAVEGEPLKPSITTNNLIKNKEIPDELKKFNLF